MNKQSAEVVNITQNIAPNKIQFSPSYKKSIFTRVNVTICANWENLQTL